MAELTPQDMAAKLVAFGFERSGPSATKLSDPIVDTPIMVTLDQLRPYDHDPRIARNPAYDDIKASIRGRGLDAPPAITRRPEEGHYIIRNGGNTRLAILHELWSETKDERFFRITCLFRPWPERGEVVMLTGHLAENELRGGLTFIERALGVEKAREFYEKEADGQALTQSELARRLSADGFPVPQPHISRMQDAVRYLLPVIPTVLYGGLGRPQVSKLVVLRKAAERTWEQRAMGKSLSVDFAALFQDVLAQFDTPLPSFPLQRVQDELVGQMAALLDVDYDTLSLEIDDSEARQQMLASDPAPTRPGVTFAPSPQSVTESAGAPSLPAPAVPATAVPPLHRADGTDATKMTPSVDRDGGADDRMQAHIVSPAMSTERLQSIQRMVADQMGDALPDFEANVLRAVPVQAGGLYPISDVWFIEPGLDVPDRLRVHIAQFAHEIAQEAGAGKYVEACDHDIGFVCSVLEAANDLQPFGCAVLALLDLLSGTSSPRGGGDQVALTRDWAPLLHGHGTSGKRLSDAGLVKLFRLLRLARRLLDLEAGGAVDDDQAKS